MQCYCVCNVPRAGSELHTQLRHSTADTHGLHTLLTQHQQEGTPQPCLTCTSQLPPGHSGTRGHQQSQLSSCSTQTDRQMGVRGSFPTAPTRCGLLCPPSSSSSCLPTQQSHSVGLAADGSDLSCVKGTILCSTSSRPPCAGRGGSGGQPQAMHSAGQGDTWLPGHPNLLWGFQFFPNGGEANRLLWTCHRAFPAPPPHVRWLQGHGDLITRAVSRLLHPQQRRCATARSAHRVLVHVMLLQPRLKGPRAAMLQAPSIPCGLHGARSTAQSHAGLQLTSSSSGQALCRGRATPRVCFDILPFPPPTPPLPSPRQ